jgi:hypothetical protein
VSPRRDLTFGAQAGLRAPTSSMDGSREQRAALDAQLRSVRALEPGSVYREMCAAADARRRAGGDYAHGWGAFNAATGDPAKARKRAAS